MPSRLSFSKIWPVAALLGIIVLINWQLLFTKEYTFVESPDIVYQAIPWYQFSSSQLHHGEFPLWESYTWSGQPLVGQVQPGVMHPLHLLYLSLPLRKNNGHIQLGYLHTYFVLLHCIAALGCFLLIRSMRGSVAAALLGGVLFAVGGYIGTTHWVNIVHAAVHIPWALYFLRQVVYSGFPIRNAALCGLIAGLCWLAGHHNVPILLTLTCTGFWVVIAVTRKLRWQIAVLTFVTFGVAMSLVGAAQIIPAIEYGRLAIRWLGDQGTVQWNDIVPYFNHKALSLRPHALIGIFVPIERDGYRPYIGLAAALLAGIGIVSFWRKSTDVRVSIVLAVASLFYALGAYSPFHGVLYAFVPFVEKARWPGSALALFHCAASVLCALGLDAVTSERNSPKLRLAARAAMAAFAVWLLFLFFVANVYGSQHPIDERISLAFFVAVLFGAALYAWNSGALSHRAFTASIIFLVAVDVGTMAQWFYQSEKETDRPKFLHLLSQHDDIAEFLQSKGNDFRAELDGKAVPYNFGDWYGINTNNGYLPSLTANSVSANWSRPAKRFMAVRYWVGREPQFSTQKEVFRSKSGLIVYEDPEALPRAWIAHEIRAGGVDALSSWIASKPQDLRVAFSTTLKPSGPCATGEGRAEIVSATPNRVEIRASAACPAVLVLSDTYFPGWRAHIDGRKVEIHEINSRIRGVELPPGDHAVRFEYRPLSVRIGVIGSLCGVLFVIAVVTWSRVNAAKNQSAPVALTA